MNLDTVLAQQTELHHLLDSLRAEVDRSVAASGGQPAGTTSSGDQERAEIHAMALDSATQLDNVAGALKNLVEEINGEKVCWSR